MQKKKWVTPLIHIIAWALYFSLPYLLRPDRMGGGGPSMHRGPRLPMFEISMITNVLMVPLFYFNVAVLYPAMIRTRRFGLFLLVQLGIAFVLFLGMRGIVMLISDVDSMRLPFGIPLFSYSFILLSALCYALVRDNIRTEQLQQEKENENLKSELLFLRWQISPHFLFNVLNNLVALARMKSDKMEPMLIRLSSLMRYMLYETDDKKLAIEKEVDYLESYVSLQSLRYGKEVTVSIKVDENLPGHLLIEPMLLIPFVENAFKHGTGMIAAPVIEIALHYQAPSIIFEVRNKYLTQPEQTSPDRNHGIGLANVKRRLNLLYPHRHKLGISTENGWYIASLQIQIA
jgi:sensor histidine kinase YesM